MDKNIDTRLRKPRRTKGTPLYYSRNYFALGTIAVGGVCWILFELWPVSRKLKSNFLQGKFDPSPAVELHFKRMQAGHTDPALDEVLEKVKRRKEQKDEEESGEAEPWYSKYFQEPKV